jgi:hypothetical protein
MCKKSKQKKNYIIFKYFGKYGQIWVPCRITYHIIFFTYALFRCAIHTTTTTSIYSQ